MSIATTSDFETAPARPLATPLILAAGCVVLADWLFYGWNIGISLALFLGVLGVVALFSNGVQVPRTSRIILIAIFIAGLLPLIEEVNFLSVCVATLASAMSVIALTSRQATSWQRQLFEAVTIPFRGTFQLVAETVGALRRMNIWTPAWLGWLVAWIVPLTVFAIFLTLFSSANPLIEHRLMQIDLRALFALIDSRRLAFWFFIACLVWPLIHRRIKSRRAREPVPALSATAASELDYLLGPLAITRSLVLFNALFALQTALDLTYLWGGAALPDGMSYASYAHRGAYPLIATALLAAGFVLLAMRPGGPAEGSRLIRPLVLIWIAQNILLVVSSIFRLDLYVAVYSLTYWRLAAFIWMVLVAAGLLLVLCQIVWQKPNSWLLTANAATLALALYGCCFINAPWLVAHYNVEHCQEVGGTGPTLDLQYLGSLGPQALLALERHRKDIPGLLMAMDIRFPNGRNFFPHSENWRTWSFRTWRLKRYLANNPEIPLVHTDRGQG
jgi:hypothetical protein